MSTTAQFEPIPISIAFEDNPNISVNSVNKLTWKNVVLQTYNSLQWRHSAIIWNNQTEYKNWVTNHITDAILDKSDINYNHPKIDTLLDYIRCKADIKELLDCISVDDIDVYPSGNNTDFEIDGVFDPNLLSITKNI